MRFATRRRLAALTMVAASVCLLPSSVDTRVQGQGSSVPALPATVDTTYNQPAAVTNVPADGNLQTAINKASLGTTIMLQAGATYGAITLPNKPGTGWIYVVSNGTLPVPGNRVLPAQAAQLAKIQVGSNTAAISTSSGAHHFRFVGIEVSVTGTLQGALVNLDGGGPSTQPHHIILDRCYVHGTTGGTHRRGIALRGGDLAVIDSYVAEFHENGSDSQAIASWDGTGPLKVVNSFLQAASENIMFGGAEPTSGTVGPSDIEIRGNYIFKPLSWQSSGVGVKNLIELKNARRLLAEGNIFENNWASAQTGAGIVLTPRNENGGCPGCGLQDVTFRYNRLINSARGVGIAGIDNNFPSTRADRMLFEHNEFQVVTETNRGYQIVSGPSNLVMTHNTWTTGKANPDTAEGMVENLPDKSIGFVFTNNIAGNLWGSGTGNANQTLATYFTNPVYTSNALVGISSSTAPAGNFFPSSLAAATMNGNDGKPVGVDKMALAAATACTVSGQCAGVSGGDTRQELALDRLSGWIVRAVGDFAGDVCSAGGWVRRNQISRQYVFDARGQPTRCSVHSARQ